jgi:hypothetical protein
MSKKMFMAVACLGLGIGFGTRPAAAQTMDVRVTLPFAAKVGDVSLPAGEYRIREVNDSLVKISSTAYDGAYTFATMTPIVAPNHETVDHTKVILRQGAKGYQIDKIWLEGQDMGFELNTGGE